MKLSMKLRDDTPNQPPLLKAKIPITVLTLPFTAGLASGHSTDLSFSLTSNFPSCPSLRLSYSPTSPSPTTPNPGPFTLTLKSGVGSFGSPKDSPLTISANLNLFHDRNPTFTLQIRPQLGHFSVHKTAHSDNNPRPDVGVGSGPGLMGWSNIDLEAGKGVTWRDLKMETLGEKNGVLEGFKVRARSELPIGRKLMVNFRWGVNFGNEVRKERMPYLTVDKIGIQRVVEEVEKKKVVEDKVGGEVEKLSGMCGWMRRELEELRRENWELRRSLEGIRGGVESRGSGLCGGFEERRSKGKAGSSFSSTAYSGYPELRSRRSDVEESVGVPKEVKKGVGVSGSSSLESELQKAIKAAAAS